MTDTDKRDKFLAVFAAWLIDAGHATSSEQADRLAWDFVVSAWDGDDDLESWQAAYQKAANDQVAPVEDEPEGALDEAVAYFGGKVLREDIEVIG